MASWFVAGVGNYPRKGRQPAERVMIHSFSMFSFPTKAVFVIGEQGQLESLLTSPLVPVAVIGVLFYFMLIRPERRKRSDLNAMVENLKKNDRVVTIGGIYGTVVNAQKGSEDVSIKVDETTNTKLRILRSSVSRVITDKDDSDKKD